MTLESPLDSTLSLLVVCDSLRSHGLQHARLSCPSLSPRVCSNSCPLSQWCYLTISSSAAPISFCLLSFPASGSFTKCRLFSSGGQGTGASASASVLPINTQGWFPLGLTKGQWMLLWGIRETVVNKQKLWQETFDLVGKRHVIHIYIRNERWNSDQDGAE